MVEVFLKLKKKVLTDDWFLAWIATLVDARKEMKRSR